MEDDLAGGVVDQRDAVRGRGDEDAASAVDRFAFVGGGEARVKLGGKFGPVLGAPGPDFAAGVIRGAEVEDKDLVPAADDKLAAAGRGRSAGRQQDAKQSEEERHDHSLCSVAGTPSPRLARLSDATLD